MKKPMTNFKIEAPEVKKHALVKSRRGLVYAENGFIRTYSNRTQAQKKVDELNASNALGVEVSYSFAHPFVIVPA